MAAGACAQGVPGLAAPALPVGGWISGIAGQSLYRVLRIERLSGSAQIAAPDHDRRGGNQLIEFLVMPNALPENHQFAIGRSLRQ